MKLPSLLLARGATLALWCLAALPEAHAGQGTIRETDTEIVIEYWGTDDDRKTAEELKAEREKKEAEEKARLERIKERNARREAARRASQDDE
jgi:hypothetical protein